MKKRNWIFPCAMAMVLPLLLSACGTQEDPQINPSPQYFLTLHGKIDPALQKEIQLRFIQTYVGSNPQCAHVTNVIAGIKENPARNKVFLAEPDPKTGLYEVKVPLDYYTSGYCHWISWDMGYSLTNEEFKTTQEDGGYELISYDNQQSEKENPSFYNFICPLGNVSALDGTDNCTIKISENGLVPIYLKNNFSYSQELNVLIGSSS